MEDDNPYKNLNFVSQTYNALDDAMVEAYENNDCKKSIELAAQLLSKSDLPTLIRARCHMMLSLRKGSDLAVQHAEAAVEILDVEARELVSPDEFPQEHPEQARDCLRQAKEDAEKRKSKAEAVK